LGGGEIVNQGLSWVDITDYGEDGFLEVRFPQTGHTMCLTPQEMLDLSWTLWYALENGGYLEEEVSDEEFEKFRRKLMRRGGL
jgi:hypothetical protein